MFKSFSLENQTALITGGGTGIGKAIAHCMVKAGGRVLLTGRREEVLAEACREMDPSAAYIVHDITCLDKREQFLQSVLNKVGTPDILVNNAGIHLKKNVSDTTEEEMLEIFNTNVLGSYSLTRLFIPGFVDRGSGSILFITSMAAVFGIPYVSAYSAAKTSLLGLVRSYATELSPKGIRVNAIAPGWIETNMSKHAMENDPQRKDKVLSRTPMHRMGKPEDIGWAAVYLSSQAARFITGQQLVVDGGISVGF